MCKISLTIPGTWIGNSMAFRIGLIVECAIPVLYQDTKDSIALNHNFKLK